MLEFIDIALIALSGVSFAWMIDQFTDEGMIFSFWGRFLHVQKKYAEGGLSWYLKPLWGCLVCTNIWMIALMMVLFYFAHGVWAVVFAFSLGNLFLDLILKYTE